MSDDGASARRRGRSRRVKILASSAGAVLISLVIVLGWPTGMFGMVVCHRAIDISSGRERETCDVFGGNFSEEEFNTPLSELVSRLHIYTKPEDYRRYSTHGGWEQVDYQYSSFRDEIHLAFKSMDMLGLSDEERRPFAVAILDQLRRGQGFRVETDLDAREIRLIENSDGADRLVVRFPPKEAE